MSLGRVIGTLVVILVLYAIVTAPQEAASSVQDGASTAADAGTSITVFFSSIVSDVAGATGARSSTGIGDPVYPDGGVETGDGSTPTAP
ncbi:hypothetical protein ACQPX6_23950 [Actinomycetospora sp. CA-101289]|uniref:hypothetical protein n=1 Tax=Actinomycetospora sp. CA-101289 TaxID=3239893 RepID=UPI003D994744